MTGSYTIEAGALVRGQVKREITTFLWRLGINVNVEEAKGLLTSTYRFSMSGDETKLRTAFASLNEWGKRIAEEDRST